MITLSPGSELSFISPGLVAGVLRATDPNDDESVILSAIDNLTLAVDTGNPGATRRIVGVETSGPAGTLTVAGMYVLDYFEGATVFRGRHYDVDADSGAVSTMSLSLTIANGGSWPTVAMTVATMLILSGDNATITVGVVRENDNYGSFDGVFADGVDSQLSGTWCDIGGAVGSTVAPIPPTPTTKILITWSEVEEADFYDLYRVYRVSGGTSVRIGDNITLTRHEDTTSADADYSYQVEAFSSRISIEITWSEVEEASFYKLYRSTVSGGMSVQIGGNITLTSYQDRPSAGADYFYQVEACNSDDECSPLSGEVSTLPAPDAPDPISVAVVSVTISLSWSAVEGADFYNLYRSTVSGGTPTLVGGDISTTTYTDSRPSADTDYFYRLQACNSGGCSELSQEASTLPAPAAPGMINMALTDSGEISLGWDPVSVATSYKLYRSENSDGPYVQIAQIGDDLSAPRYEDGDISAGTTYYYQIEACNSGGCSERSTEVSVTTAPAVPVLEVGEVGSDQISVTWEAVPGATSYNLYRLTVSGGTPTLVGGNLATLTYTDNNDISAGTPYFYQLEACNSGGCSERSTEVSATTVPEQPGMPTATAQSSTEIVVTWEEVSGATSYRIYRSDMRGGTYTRIGSDDNISELTYTDSGLTANTPYFYQLEACNSGGCSSRSPEADGMTNS